MEQHLRLAERFEASRAHLEAVAYRMLGSRMEAEDAVQETWLRLARADAHDITNLGGWLTTVVTRVCLDVLRARRSRGEGSLEDQAGGLAARDARSDPEREAALADAVGVAMLVVLDRLAPAERVAFVLHDMFDLSFDEIAPIIDRSVDAARQLASRGRRRVRGEDVGTSGMRDRKRQREIAHAYLQASRTGDLAALLTLLAPDVVLHVDAAAVPTGKALEVQGAEAIGRRALAYGARAGDARLALVNGSVGFVVAPYGRLAFALAFTFADDRIVRVDLVADPERLHTLTVAPLDR